MYRHRLQKFQSVPRVNSPSERNVSHKTYARTCTCHGIIELQSIWLISPWLRSIYLSNRELVPLYSSIVLSRRSCNFCWYLSNFLIYIFQMEIFLLTYGMRGKNYNKRRTVIMINDLQDGRVRTFLERTLACCYHIDDIIYSVNLHTILQLDISDVIYLVYRYIYSSGGIIITSSLRYVNIFRLWIKTWI